MRWLGLVAIAVAGGGTASAQPGAAATFTVGTETAGRGQKAFGSIEVRRGADAPSSIPVANIGVPAR